MNAGDITRSPPLITAADREVHYRPGLQHFGSHVVQDFDNTTEIHAWKSIIPVIKEIYIHSKL